MKTRSGGKSAVKQSNEKQCPGVSKSSKQIRSDRMHKRKTRMPGFIAKQLLKLLPKALKDPDCYVCLVDNCGFAVQSRSTLKHHIDGMHGDEKGYPCSTCGKCFHQEKNLNKHIKSVHGGWRCCEQQFTEKVMYKRHRKMQHQEIFESVEIPESAFMKLEDFLRDYASGNLLQYREKLREVEPQIVEHTGIRTVIDLEPDEQPASENSAEHLQDGDLKLAELKGNMQAVVEENDSLKLSVKEYDEKVHLMQREIEELTGRLEASHETVIGLQNQCAAQKENLQKMASQEKRVATLEAAGKESRLTIGTLESVIKEKTAEVKRVRQLMNNNEVRLMEQLQAEQDKISRTEQILTRERVNNVDLSKRLNGVIAEKDMALRRAQAAEQSLTKTLSDLKNAEAQLSQLQLNAAQSEPRGKLNETDQNTVKCTIELLKMDIRRLAREKRGLESTINGYRLGRFEDQNRRDNERLRGENSQLHSAHDRLAFGLAQIKEQLKQLSKHDPSLEDLFQALRDQNDGKVETFLELHENNYCRLLAYFLYSFDNEAVNIRANIQQLEMGRQTFEERASYIMQETVTTENNIKLHGPIGLFYARKIYATTFDVNGEPRQISLKYSMCTAIIDVPNVVRSWANQKTDLAIAMGKEHSRKELPKAHFQILYNYLSTQIGAFKQFLAVAPANLYKEYSDDPWLKKIIDMDADPESGVLVMPVFGKSHDDRFILKWAVDEGAFIVSNDRYTEHLTKIPEIFNDFPLPSMFMQHEWLTRRILPYTYLEIQVSIAVTLDPSGYHGGLAVEMTIYRREESVQIPTQFELMIPVDRQYEELEWK